MKCLDIEIILLKTEYMCLITTWMSTCRDLPEPRTCHIVKSHQFRERPLACRKHCQMPGRSRGDWNTNQTQANLCDLPCTYGTNKVRTQVYHSLASLPWVISVLRNPIQLMFECRTLAPETLQTVCKSTWCHLCGSTYHWEKCQVTEHIFD